MKPFKTITLLLTGYKITGESTICLWGGGSGTINIKQTILPIDKLTKSNIIRCINDGEFGCEAIKNARIVINEVYGYEYVVPVKELYIDCMKANRQNLVCRGV